ncbi:YicC/YloC family endoribonuclease [Kushneria phosphatilytica]|uniref:YicC family protein n=1 Tax=Kushneria phosphatilytica TaxID=657387 RepID=A0A1S1NTB7_9GAMM|nr:YicC/YloC family endoribonuclease [Kushneria phosphatilytica]OHV08835.1 YicC family protein [Kushneria phosphatilytica]QEL12555.1 YicC family protein [Kushneria phosphatilytica]
MVRSMTAFARQTLDAEWGSLAIELRSVNQRYLDLHFRLPDSLRELEAPLRERLRGTLSRGKVECTLRLTLSEQQHDLSIDHEGLERLVTALTEVRRIAPEAAMPSALALLDHPGVSRASGPDGDTLREAALKLFDETLHDLDDGRAREGERLAELIRERLTGIREQVTEVRAHLPEVLERQRNQILERLESVKAELDPARLEAEMALIAQKSDVAEELDRLDTHVGEVERQLRQKGPIGRRLDFLMQELNREANTLSSKAVVTDTTRCAVELKVLIEQMREQIQNIE